MSMRDAFNKAGHGGAKQYPGQKQGGSYPQRQGVGTIPSDNANNPPKIILRHNGQLRRELLTSEAEQWADFLHNNGNGITATQLRNFFNEVKALQSRIEASGFQANDALIGLLKSKAAYAYARAERKRETGFRHMKSMIEQGVDLTKSVDPRKAEEAFNDFALFFEAVMGFFKGR